MKKIILATTLFVGIFSMNAQQWNGNNNTTDPISRTGNVGIGTSTPSKELEVIGTVKGDVGIFNKSLPDGTVFPLNGVSRNDACLVLGVGRQFSESGFILNVLDFPQSNMNPQAQSFFGMEDRNYNSRWRFTANTGGASTTKFYNKNQSEFYNLTEDGNDNVYLRLPKANSHITIGTNSYIDNGEVFKLNVNGKVRAHEIKVNTGWADFVFEENYKLPSLHEVEEYIENHGHLKDIPSAKQVENDGIELGEINKLLLQKIEELTLYTIEQEKRIKALEATRAEKE